MQLFANLYTNAISSEVYIYVVHISIMVTRALMGLWSSYQLMCGEGGGVLGISPLTWLLYVVARNEKNAFESSSKIIKRHFIKFLAKVHIEITRGNQISNLVKFHISSEMCHYPGNSSTRANSCLCSPASRISATRSEPQLSDVRAPEWHSTISHWGARYWWAHWLVFNNETDCLFETELIVDFRNFSLL